MYKVYGDSKSGNCYKIKLLLHQLKVPFEWYEVNVLQGETHTEEFLAKNPSGKIPVLETPEGDFLSESNAILWYLAEDSNFIPKSRLGRQRVLQWQFFEQYSHEPFIATARFIVKYLNQEEEQKEVLQEKRRGGYQALDVMEKELATRAFISGEQYTIADISLYAYTHVALSLIHISEPTRPY